VVKFGEDLDFFFNRCDVLHEALFIHDLDRHLEVGLDNVVGLYYFSESPLAQDCGFVVDTVVNFEFLGPLLLLGHQLGL